MRYLILSDIHANIDALDAVLEAAAGRGYDRVLLLGDLVGYGGAPNEVLARVRGLDVAAAVRGNHDKVATGAESTDNFNPLAKEAADWTRAAIRDEHLGYLAGLAQGPVAVDSQIEICHGTPFDEDEYVFDGLDAMRAIDAARCPVCLFGHTHMPIALVLQHGELDYADVRDGDALALAGGAQYLINVGSVGQPRDGNPAAAFGILDTEGRRVEFARAPYPVEAAQARILAAGLPGQLASRLATGR